jgi:hypothetical protein
MVLLDTIRILDRTHMPPPSFAVFCDTALSDTVTVLSCTDTPPPALLETELRLTEEPSRSSIDEVQCA